MALHREHPLDNVLCIAESGDGRCWVKPDMGNGTNIVMTSSGHETGWGVFMPTRILINPRKPTRRGGGRWSCGNARSLKHRLGSAWL
ncbi:MAG: hypothetical protein VYB08_06395 [Candidatus Latescibacterota bacterium]|nr:hypothetical protein [Candidatus Latescibacterota bacterium]